MKSHNRVSKALIVMTLASAMIVTSAIWNNRASRVSAFNPQPDPPAFGMIGITHEQTARLNVVAIASVDPGPCTPTEVDPGPCRVQIEMTFFNSDGDILLRSTETLTVGHATLLDLNGISLPSSTLRTELRAEADIIDSSDPDRSLLRLIANVEVIDNETGRTTVLLPTVR